MKRLKDLFPNTYSSAHAAATTECAELLGRSDISPGSPADLADEMPHFLAPISGARVGARLLPTDVGVGRMSPVTALFQIAPLGIFLGVMTVSAIGVALLILYAVVFYLFFWPFFSRFSSQLQGMLNPGDGDIAVSIAQEIDAKRKQCERAKQDQSAFFEVGKSSSKIGGIHGADRGRSVGITARDLSTHLFAWGATGSGKTSGVLRPLAKFWSADVRNGLMVIDGKGDLPREFVGKLVGYRLLVPGVDPVDLLADLEPHDVVSALMSAAAVQDSDSDFWSRSASDLLYHACVIAYAGAQLKSKPLVFSLVAIARVLQESKYRAEVCIALAKSLDSENLTLHRALSFFSAGWEPEKNNTQAGVLATAASLVTTLLRHPALCKWAQPQPGVECIRIADVLRGARYGIDVPEYRYGVAAAAVTNLLRAQVYRAAKQRGSAANWKGDAAECLVLVDEAAIALGELESQILPVARSLGLYFCCATQNIEQFTARFGEAGAKALVDQFRSQVCLNASVATREYVQRRAGSGITFVQTLNQAHDYDITMAREATQGYRTSQFFHEMPILLSGMRIFLFGREPQDPATNMRQLLCGPIFKPDNELPLADGEALCVLNRANYKRVETVFLNRQFS